jgi:hypothetical protein
VDTDDDNFPEANWKYPVETGPFYVARENQGFLNVYEYYSSQENFWPRGFPLDEIVPALGRLASAGVLQETTGGPVGIWQGLVNGDSDLDAIYRLTHKEITFTFSENYPVILGKGCYCPINSQNTYFTKELFPLLYIPSTVPFRYTDILRGYIAQIVAAGKGYKIGFTSANAFQVRNAHNLMVDFEDEIQMYRTCKKAVDIAETTFKENLSIEDNLYQIYSALLREKIVSDTELDALNAFLLDITQD